MQGSVEIGKNNIFREEELDLKKYLYVIFKKKWILFSFVTVALVVSLVSASKQVPLYQAHALILIEQPSSNLSLRSRSEQINPRNSKDYYNTQYELLKSRAMTKRASEMLGLERDPFQGKISVNPITGTQLVNIRATYTDPEMAAKMVNTLVDLFMQQSIENRLYLSKEVLKFLPEDDAEKIKRQTSLGKLQSLSQDEIVEALPSVASDPVLSKLRAEKAGIETQLFTLQQRYKEKHPKIVALLKRLSYIDERVPIEKERILRGLRADLMGALAINNIRVIEYAKAPGEPLKSPIAQNVIYGLFFSTFLGLGVIFLTEYFDDTVKNQQDIENKVNLPYLGEFPLLAEDVPHARGEAHEFLKLEKLHEVFEAIRNIRTNIIFSTPKEDLRTILITSTVPKEGKSFIASYLAYSFAKNGVKTLLIDADVRKPTIHRLFKIERSPGLTNILVENTPPESVIKESGEKNLYLLPCGSKTPSPLELLSSNKLKGVVKGLLSEFEKIVIDSPPSLLLSDTLVLSKLADASILVAKSGAISKEAFIKIKNKFNASGSKILGVILNFFEIKKHSHYYKYRHYHNYYKSYYTSDGEQLDKKTHVKEEIKA